jgi:uncharacterized protein YecE (DUF72 family)
VTIRIGTSGWSYDHWHGVLYPHGSPPAHRLAHYVARFDTVELNASFYRWPRPATFASWRRRLPDGFSMVVKAPRGLTHARKLLHPEVWIERIEAGWDALGPRAGVLLVQLPPGLARDDARLDWFLGAMPSRIPVAVEFRHDTWVDDAVFGILERHDAAYVVLSGANLPCVLRATAPFVYVRFHGPSHDHLYAGSYSDDDLRWWADRIREWSAPDAFHPHGRDIYGYFNNDGEGHAVRNAWRLRELLGG